MLVMNFSTENYDQRVRLPVAGSAKPAEEDKQISEDRLVLNIDQDGHLLFGGEVQNLHKAVDTIRHQAELIKINMKAVGHKPDATGGLPTTIILRADKETDFESVLNLIKACQSNGFRKFALKAMTSG
jgi:biopolymer transport protein ExbD